jgi:putative hydrolase of the HAD superfamily
VIPTGAVRGVSFDFGHVLVGIDFDELRARLGRGDVAALRAAMPAAYRAHDEAVARGAGHERGWKALMAVFVRTAGVEAADEAVDRLWAAQPVRNLWRHVPDEARALVADLHAARVPLVLTSNSEGGLVQLLGEVGLTPYFRAILDSGVLGISKPDRRMFELAAEKLGVPLGQVLHIGDSESADIEGAVRAGAWAVRFDAFAPNSGPTVAHEIAHDFDALREIAWRACFEEGTERYPP